MTFNHLSHASEFTWENSELTSAHNYLIPLVLRLLDKHSVLLPKGNTRLFDLGCGNGSASNIFSRHGWDVTGIDLSKEGIAFANSSFSDLKLFYGSVYEDLFLQYGQFPVVVSLEVVEHLYYPRSYADTLYSLVEPGGIAIISTPYHGYWKNLALALLGKWDDHFTALWDHGHIKFWSIETLGTLLKSPGFKNISFFRVGRFPLLAKSMIAVAFKPLEE